MNGKMKLGACIFLALMMCWTAQAQKIVITAGGDTLLGGDKAKKTDARFAAFVKEHGYGYVYKNLMGLFATDDITILNLEGPLVDAKRPNKPQREYHLYGQPEYANILTKGSVEVVNVVNNHINDYGTKPQTLDILKKAGVVVSNTSFKPETNSIVVRGVRVGFVGYQTPVGVNALRNGIKQARASCDVVIASLHFGEVPEHTHAIRNSQVKMARAAIDAGADLVLGHHPHVVSGIELYKDKYIFYDLGSVESSGKNFRYDNMLARITLEVDKQAGTVKTRVPVVYAGCASGAPAPQDNNCQPILWRPGEEGYQRVFDIIDQTSKRKGIVAAPYIRGVP